MMSLSNDLTNLCYRFERSCKSKLNDQTPIFSNLIFKRYNKSNIETLVNEIFYRSVLLLVRSMKCFYTATLCVLSPLSTLVGERLAPPSLAWKNFCREVRYLGAESFEMIGVVACSILLLPFDRQSSRYLINAQIWVETTAEWISGERVDIHYIQEILGSAKKKKKLLLQARNIIEVSQEEVDKWVKVAIDFDEVVSRIDTLKNRRIARNYQHAYLSKNKLDEKLLKFESFVSDRIATIAIPKQQEVLKHLKQLQGQSKAESEMFYKSQEKPQSDLNTFEQLSSEIETTIDQLHSKHDPQGIIRNEYDDLKKRFFEVSSQALRDLSKLNVARRMQLINQHFFDVGKKLDEIEHIYSYRNVTHSSEVFSKNFVSDLRAQIAQGHKLLEDARLTWSAENRSPLDRPKALKILRLTEAATRGDIRRSFMQLSLVHHPDKGGQGHVFDIIKQAYDLLIA